MYCLQRAPNRARSCVQVATTLRSGERARRLKGRFPDERTQRVRRVPGRQVGGERHGGVSPLGNRRYEVVREMAGMAARGRVVRAVRAGRRDILSGILRLGGGGDRTRETEPDCIDKDHGKQSLQHEEAQAAIHGPHSTGKSATHNPSGLRRRLSSIENPA